MGNTTQLLLSPLAKHFKVRHKYNTGIKQLDIPLTHGSFLPMGETMQDLYEHHVPKTAKKISGTINLTFRISEPGRPVTLLPSPMAGSSFAAK
jgi:hypothetical protein